MKVWIIHEIIEERYRECVIFHGVATNEFDRDNIAEQNPGSTVTEMVADMDHNRVEGAENFHELPSW